MTKYRYNGAKISGSTNGSPRTWDERYADKESSSSDIFQDSLPQVILAQILQYLPRSLLAIAAASLENGSYSDPFCTAQSMYEET